jgi:hypothetical protein
LAFYAFHQQDLNQFGNAAVEHCVVYLCLVVAGIERRLEVGMTSLQLLADNVQLVGLHVRLYYCSSYEFHQLW